MKENNGPDCSFPTARFCIKTLYHGGFQPMKFMIANAGPGNASGADFSSGSRKMTGYFHRR
jgi:hypothetical protein